MVVVDVDQSWYGPLKNLMDQIIMICCLICWSTSRSLLHNILAESDSESNAEQRSIAEQPLTSDRDQFQKVVVTDLNRDV